MDLVNALSAKIEELSVSIRQLRKTGNALAEAERDYKIILRQEALKLRTTEGLPVTLIQQVVYGVKEVAEARYKRDIAEAMYQANQEHINATKLQIRIIESQLGREYGQAKY